MTATVAVVAVIAVGCHPTPPEAADDPTRATGAPGSSGASVGRSPVAYATGGLDLLGGADGPDDPSLGASPVDDGRTAPSAAGAAVEAGPEVVAAGLVADRLADEGLETVWVDTRLLEATESGATVQVQVAHSSGRGHPTQSSYQLTLLADAGGWRVERFVKAG
jgi:hypothetical protein